jgi:hypothetical protein
VTWWLGRDVLSRKLPAVTRRLMSERQRRRTWLNGLATPTPTPTPTPTASGATTGIARWQKVVGIIGLVVVLGLGVLMFGPGGGGHGPRQHVPDESQERQIDTGDGGDHDPSQ